MEPKLSRAVRKIFVDLYNDGLIYRGERLVNWDPALETAVSDDEVETNEARGHLWFIRYPLKETLGEFVTIATTRPETMFGDSAIAVNPEDERFQHLIGKYASIPLANRLIPIIADSYVKKEFGTGCVKISPAHDFNDFEIAQRHKLPMPNIFDERAYLNDSCPKEFVGLERFVARKKVVAALEKDGFLEKIESHQNSLPYSERSKVVIEPRLSKQWYVRMKTLAEPAIEYARKGELKFYPDMWKKTYFHWLENIQDWCISRQLWWGHRLPIWYCQSCSEIMTGLEDPTSCSKCKSTDLKQDEDVLDTWFSSWLWPLSPFGWPEETEDLKKFFPSNVIVTAPEIIFLWVARMIMVSHYTRGQLAFKDVYFNSVICDKQGRKYSKTLGNGIDPLDTIEKHGADATRFTCTSLAPLGGRVRLDPEDFANSYRFINKLWNASRFLKQKWEGKQIGDFSPKTLTLPNKWLIHQLRETVLKVNEGLGTYAIHDACREVYHFIWHIFCDWGLETAKIDFDDENSEQTLSTLLYVFEGLLRLAAPFMPFVCEDIWQELPYSKKWDRPESLVIARFPQVDMIPSFEKDAEEWEWIRSLISGVRSIRTQAGISPKQKLDIFVNCSEERAQLVKDCEHWIAKLAQASSIHATRNIRPAKQSLTAAGKDWAVYVPVGDLLDVGKERARLERELIRIQKITAGLDAKLNDPTFAGRAPEDVIATTKDQLENMRSQEKAIKENLLSLV
jgi:valyl-tRNA synthetase